MSIDRHPIYKRKAFLCSIEKNMRHIARQSANFIELYLSRTKQGRARLASKDQKRAIAKLDSDLEEFYHTMDTDNTYEDKLMQLFLNRDDLTLPYLSTILNNDSKRAQQLRLWFHPLELQELDEIYLLIHSYFASNR